MAIKYSEKNDKYEKKVIKIKVITETGLQEPLHYIQYSTEIPIEFRFLDYEIPENSTARFYLRKKSGAEVYNDCRIEENSVILEPTAQTFAEYGLQKGQVQILSEDDKVLMSWIIACDVERNIISDSAIESKDEFGALQEALRKVEKADKTIAEAAETAQEALEIVEESRTSTEAAKAATEETRAATSDAETATRESRAATKAAQTATKDAWDAAEKANAARDDTISATEAAKTATEDAKQATKNANTAADNANAAADKANSAADNLEDVKRATQEAVDAANQTTAETAQAANEAMAEATEATNAAIEEAKAATEESKNATQETKAATDAANTATQEAKSATEKTKEATKETKSATEAAKTATEDARQAAQNANDAATSAKEVEAEVQRKLEAGEFVGPEGKAATIKVGEVLTGDPNTDVEITNYGTDTDAVLDFKIPRGEKGETGDQGLRGERGETGEQGLAATIGVGNVDTVAPDASAEVLNTGSENAAILDFKIPKGVKGDTGTITIGKVDTVGPTDKAEVTNSGNENDAIFDFKIPQGIQGEQGQTGLEGKAATIEVGQVITVEPNDNAEVTNSGNENAAILDFKIPKGVKGDTGGQGDKGENGISPTLLPTDANLDDYQGEEKIGFYYINGTNSATNKPDGVDSFGLVVIRAEDNSYEQILCDSQNNIWVRRFGSEAWTSWSKGISSQNIVDANITFTESETNDVPTSGESISTLFGKFKKLWTNYTANVDATTTKLNKKADLGDDGKVLAAQLPSFVDDVEEYEDQTKFPQPQGEDGKIYVDKSTNKVYRWSGTEYIEISPSLALGNTAASAYRGDFGEIAYNHTLNKDNPHEVNKNQVGLGNVENKAIGDLTPTFVESETNDAPASGETISTLFGKFLKLWSDFENYKNNQLTDEDLNNYQGEDYIGFYYAIGSNTVQNKPGNEDSFGMQVIRTAGGYYQQYLIDNAGKIYQRIYNGTEWSEWSLIYPVKAVDKLTTGRTIQTDLASSDAPVFDGTQNIKPGVTGTLPVGKGGTGATAADAARTNLGAAATNHTHNELKGDLITTIPRQDDNNIFVEMGTSNANNDLSKVHIGAKDTGQAFVHGYKRADGSDLGYHLIYDTAHKPTAADVGAVNKAGDTITGQLYLSGNGDAVGTAAGNPPLIVGLKTGDHLAIDGNEIQAKNTETKVQQLNLNMDGGNVLIGNDGVTNRLITPGLTVSGIDYTITTDQYNELIKLFGGGLVNLLKDTDAPSLTKVDGPADRYFSDTAVTYVTPTIVSIADSPCGTKYAAQYVMTNSTSNGGRALTFYNNLIKNTGVPLVAGKRYMARFWGKITSITGSICFKFEYGVTQYVIMNLETVTAKMGWKQYTTYFTAPAVGDYTYTDGSTRIYFRADSAKTGTSATVQLTGFELAQIT